MKVKGHTKLLQNTDFSPLNLHFTTGNHFTAPTSPTIGPPPHHDSSPLNSQQSPTRNAALLPFNDLNANETYHTT